ncbi:MAG TPA: dihydrofolate reductase family protein [Solirubrobacterales bacterium]|jgi:dihydrofolate reductase
MRDLIVTEFVSLNGVMEAPGGEPGHPHSGWTFESIYGEDHYAYKDQELREAEIGLLGRRTYEGFSKAWTERKEAGDDDPFTQRINAMPKYVVSTTLERADWENTSILRSIDEVRELKEGDGGPILVQGSHRLVHSLAEADLVDEWRAMIHPVLVAEGMRMFPDTADMRKLRLVDAQTYDSGVALLTYRRAES